jgi:hypothetical protein
MKLTFFCQFPKPWVLRVSGMGCYAQKCEKMSQSLHLIYTHTQLTSRPNSEKVTLVNCYEMVETNCNSDQNFLKF